MTTAAPARAPLTVRRVLLLMAALCIAAVGAALVAQHGYDMQPCPWCILQRVIFLVIALVCVIAAVLPSRPARVTFTGLGLLLALLGGAAAIWQHLVAAKSSSCNLTFADKVINALGLEGLVPALFGVTATCADAAVSVFGVPFEYWSLALFAIVAAVLVALLVRPTPAAARR